MTPSRPDADAAHGAATMPGTATTPAGDPRAVGVSFAPEHDWSAATRLLFPVLRPAGTRGTSLDALVTPVSAAGDTQPVIDPGPADLVVAYAISAAGFDVLASGDHVAAWAVAPATLREAAFRNLAAWSSGAPWSEDADERRRIVSSDTGGRLGRRPHPPAGGHRAPCRHARRRRRPRARGGAGAPPAAGGSAPAR